jgi:sec-independent protein translocase protein TatA
MDTPKQEYLTTQVRMTKDGHHLSYFLSGQVMDTSIILLALGPGQIVLIALAIILLFGVNKIPQLMKGLGRGIKDFKEEMKDDSKIEDGEEK